MSRFKYNDEATCQLPDIVLKVFLYKVISFFVVFAAATAVVVYIYEHFEASGSPVIVVGGSKYLSFEHKKEQRQIKENAEEHGSIKTTMRLNKT